MRVKRLEINGFKSFADKAVLDFPQGICAVVGPNGCGKSNVVDAVRWVLGEQSAKQLRGQSMEDVIFNGAQGRGPAGMAEVSLVFENQGDLSHPQFSGLAEIMITRRLYRSGDSEYLINKMPCRLKDIQQLLMDTGLGNRSYAIIEQGRVAAFIEAKPEERRLWLEEAAGITRYKNQKKVSLRKMDAAQQNLDRLMDIILEVETQMKRLERQAKKAQRYKELRQKIRELDLNIASHEYARLSQELKELAAEAEAVGAQLLLANQRLTGLETDLETLKVQLVAAEQEIADAGQRRLETQGEIQRVENEITLLGRDAENQRRLKERYAAECRELKSRLKELRQALDSARRQGARARQELERSREELARAQSELAALQQEQAAQEALVDDCKQALVDHLSRATQIENRLADLERYQAELRRRREALAGRRRVLEQEIGGLESSRAEARLSRRRLEESLAGHESRRRQLQEQQQGLTSRLKQATAQEQEATRRRHRLQAEADAVALSLSSYQWAGQGVRQALEAAEELDLEVLGLVAEHLEADPGSEAWVEAALGAKLQALVVKDGSAARRLAAWARQAEVGRLEVVSLEELAPLAQQVPPGASPLSAVARPRPGFEPLAALLAGVGCCQDLESAWNAARSLAPGQVLVDRQGNRLERPGAVSTGRESGDSVLARQNQLKSCRAELDQACRELERVVELRRGLEDQSERVAEELASLEAVIREQERSLAAQDQEEARLAEVLGAKRRELEALGFDAEEVAGEMERLEEERRGLEQGLEETALRRQELEDELESAQRALSEARQELEEAREREAQARLTQASSASQAQHAEQEERRLARELEAVETRLETLAQEMEQAEAKVEELMARRNREQERLGGLYLRLEEQEAAHRKARELHDQAQMKVADLESALKQARAEQRQVEEARQRLDLKKQQLIMSRDNLCDQIMERCRVDLTSDYQAHLPQGPFDPEASREKLAKLRQRLARLGAVNLEAISEHAALSERHEFLSGQKQDLEASLEDLRQAIRKINRTSRARFRETLERVNQRLAEVYPVLFQGGHATLDLDQDKDPLEAGLHLMVELPGKKVKNLEALSGGEKALSAVAVLFALFLIRPAPFCILDEVDAPLDEANVNRFHDLLARLARHCQIMMITHSRRTMEIMDLLYGVTMEEKGVSKLLAVTLKSGQAMAA